MADLISRAAAIAWFFRPYSNEESYSNLDVEKALKAIPSVDAVPVVRCKDCKHWWKANELCTHKRHVHGTVCVHECKATDYCSDWERMEAR